jgi:hypothetical protein
LPYPNEHACRLRDPEGLEIVGSDEREHNDKTYRVIFGKPKDGDGSVEQAYRYPKDSWSEEAAQISLFYVEVVAHTLDNPRTTSKNLTSALFLKSKSK